MCNIYYYLCTVGLGVKVFVDEVIWLSLSMYIIDRVVCLKDYCTLFCANGSTSTFEITSTICMVNNIMLFFTDAHHCEEGVERDN